MARRLFFVGEVRRGEAELRGEEARHLTRVLRVEPGQKYEISDNRSVYLAEVETARKDHIVFRVLEKLEVEDPPVRITLCAALIRFERFEWLVEKATELGVETIVPVETARSEPGLERAAAKRLERWRKIALESSQQARRAHAASVEEPMRFEHVLALDADYRYFPDESRTSKPLLRVLPAERKPADRLLILVGPEGGWTDAEREAAADAGWTSVCLGRQILRAETAAIAALAMLANAWLTE